MSKSGGRRPQAGNDLLQRQRSSQLPLACGTSRSWLSPRGSEELLELQPSPLHSSQQEGERVKRKTCPLLGGFFRAYPTHEDLVTWLRLASGETGKCSPYSEL